MEDMLLRSLRPKVMLKLQKLAKTDEAAETEGDLTPLSPAPWEAGVGGLLRAPRARALSCTHT